MVAKTSQSRKAKGRKFQQFVRDKLIEVLGVQTEDIESRSMGASGEDLILASAARALFPWSPEIKCVERLNVWDAWDQAVANGNLTGHKPIVIMRKNRREALAVISFDHFLAMQRELNERRTN